MVSLGGYASCLSGDVLSLGGYETSRKQGAFAHFSLFREEQGASVNRPPQQQFNRAGLGRFPLRRFSYEL